MTQTEIGVEIEATEEVEVTAVAVRQPTTLDVPHLMELALAQGDGGVEALERLVGLQERVLDRQAENALSEAIGAFQDECPMIRQTKTAKIATRSGSSYAFTYAPLDEIERTIRPHLRVHGLSYTFDSRLDGATLTVVCQVRHRDGASVSSTFTCPIDTQAKMSGAQQTGAALTYAKRQALVSALGLTVTNADADAMGTADTGAKVSKEQLTELRRLLKESGADIDRFLRFVGVAGLAEIPASSFTMAATFLRQKIDRDGDA